MTIIGIGVDIVNTDRINLVVKKYQKKFLYKILNTKELKQLELLKLKNYNNYIAKRFAAKEAISKALGVGIGEYLSFHDIHIFYGNLGKPQACIEPSNLIMKDYKIQLSLSDTDNLVIAFALVTK